MTASIDHLIMLPVLVPLLTGIALVLFARAPRRLRHGVSLVAVLVLVLVSVRLLAVSADGTITVYQLGNWPAPFGIVLVADRLAAAMVTTTALLAGCALLYATQLGRTGRYFHVLFQFQLFGLNGAFLTGDLFNLFVFFEVLLIASYGLLLQGGGQLRTRAGLHYVVLNLIGSTLFLFAVGTLYGVMGTLNMADLAQRMGNLPERDAGLVGAAGLLLFVVFALKAALAPLHIWLPAAYANAAAPVAALFAVMTKVGAYAILRVDTLIFGANGGVLAGLADPWLLVLALATLVFGVIGAMASTRLSQLVACLIVASSGTLLAAFGLGGLAAVTAGLYYLTHSVFAAAALFLLADVIARVRGEVGDRLMAGPELANSNLFGGLFLLAGLAIAGMPPLSGFLGKFMILKSSVGGPWMTWILGVVLVTSLLTVISLSRSGSRIFYEVDITLEVSTAHFDRANLAAPFTLIVLGVLLVVFAAPMYDFSAEAAQQLIDPVDYLRAVLPGAAAGDA